MSRIFSQHSKLVINVLLLEMVPQLYIAFMWLKIRSHNSFLIIHGLKMFRYVFQYDSMERWKYREPKKSFLNFFSEKFSKIIYKRYFHAIFEKKLKILRRNGGGSSLWPMARGLRIWSNWKIIFFVLKVENDTYFVTKNFIHDDTQQREHKITNG